MRTKTIALVAAVLLCGLSAHGSEELLITGHEPGRYGGRLVVSQRAEPKTFNPVTALDAPSREVIRRMNADLVSVNRETQQTLGSLARRWLASPDGREYTLELRRGLRFSDGQPFDADDVLFTFQVYLDEKVRSPQRDLLVVGGRPIQVEKVDSHTVRFRLAQPYSATDRIFDSIAVLPRHLLAKDYAGGRFAQAWGLGTPPSEIAGLGPFRLKQYVPGQRVVLERNPYYWKADREGNRLPYLSELVFRFVPDEETQVIRFLSGETDVLARIGARNFSALQKDPRTADRVLRDLGPGLDYNFLFFNLNEVDAKLPQIAARQAWFRDTAFRRAVSKAIDRDAIVKIVYDGRATPIWGHVTPGNKLWFHAAASGRPAEAGGARKLLAGAGFTWSAGGTLLDRTGKPVEFTILTTAGNNERAGIATMIQQDLQKLGMRVQTVTLEFRSVLDRVLRTFDYDACVLGLGGADGDPNSEMNVWLSSGPTHLWRPAQARPATPWEAEIDDLMRRQLMTLKQAERRRLYERVQEIERETLPIICVASPNVLVAAKKSLGNFRPSVLDHHTLWNVEELYWVGQAVPPAQGSPIGVAP